MAAFYANHPSAFATKHPSVLREKYWTKPKDRVIGHVVWAPPISFSTAPYGHTRNVCVIKLDENKLRQNFRGNVLDLGPEIDAGKFIRLMYPRVDAPSDFDYPAERLLRLRGILSAKEICTPNNKDHEGTPMRYVIKRGLTTLTTIGCLNGSVYPHDNDSGPFSGRGDSGSIIVDALGKFVVLLIGGTGPNISPDITYGSPMYWLWPDVIKAQYPSANLYFERGN